MLKRRTVSQNDSGLKPSYSTHVPALDEPIHDGADAADVETAASSPAAASSGPK
jgi:hypothetical protein